MNFNYPKVIACCLLPFLGISILSAQQTSPQFLDCSPTPERLCVQDEGVRLPANNQVYLGVGNPDATSCSVHLTQKNLVQFNFCGPLQYEVQLFIEDTSAAIVLKPLTSLTTDSIGMAELYFDTEESPDGLISGSGIPYTKGCANYHRIKWIVRDTCGEESICEQFIDLYDCKAPKTSGDPAEIFVTNLSSIGQTLLHAKDYVHEVVDDCSSQGSILYSLKSTEYVPDSILPCDQVPAYGVEIIYNIWIADAGKDLNCDGTIEWLERGIYEHPYHVVYTSFFDPCDPIDFFISGYVTDDYQRAIANVGVSINIPGQVHSTYITSNNGQYYFNADPDAAIITIFAEKNDHHKNGVSTLDLIKMQRHLLGKEEFTSPYQFIAADANNSQNISAIDLIEIRKLILGVYTDLPFNQSWRFFRKDYVFDDPMNPWLGSDPSTITILNGNVPKNTDFIGIKIGDLNGSALPHFTDVKPRGGLTAYNLLIDRLEYKNGEVIHVPIRISSNQTLTGFQFTLHTAGMEIVDVLPGQIAIPEGGYAQFGDKMTVSWFDENNVEVSADDVLFTLVLKANQAGNVSQSLSIDSELTEAEVYLDGDKTFLPVLKVSNAINENELVIESCSPNPWEDKTTVSFYLPETSNITYNLMDVNGRKIFSDSEYLSVGYHSYILKASDFSARGMLFLEINAGGNSVVQKMVVLK